MSEFIDYVSQFFRPVSASECLMYSISLLALDSVLVVVLVLAAEKVPEMKMQEPYNAVFYLTY